MTIPSLHTVRLQAWAHRIQAGDRAALDELLQTVGARLESLARKMLRAHPAVHRYEDTGDVLQNSLLRLWRALREVSPTSVRDFFGLAAEQMRRELLDLARHHYGRQAHGAHHASDVLLDGAAGVAPRDDPADLERWAAFHEGVAGLPAEEREVVGLVFYHDWTQAEVAELFQIHERTVRRRWESALVKLRGRRNGGSDP